MTIFMRCVLVGWCKYTVQYRQVSKTVSVKDICGFFSLSLFLSQIAINQSSGADKSRLTLLSNSDQTPIQGVLKNIFLLSTLSLTIWSVEFNNNRKKDIKNIKAPCTIFSFSLQYKQHTSARLPRIFSDLTL